MQFVLIALAIVAVIVFVAVVLQRRGGEAAAPPLPGLAPPPVAPSAPPLGGAAKRGLIVNHDWTFERIDRAVQECGFAPEARGAEAEPRAASWRGRHGAIRYLYEPEIRLRKLEIDGLGQDPGPIVNDLVNLAYMSTIDHQLPSFLDAATKSPQELLFGIRGSEWIGRGKNHKFYWEKVGKLRDHADPTVAAEARRVYDLLVAEGGGRPTPSGPRGLELAWTATPTGFIATQRGVRWELVGAGFPYQLVMDGKPYDEVITAWPDAWTR